MNSYDQAQKGFKTFLLTLSVSLIVFSVIYYAITTSSEVTDLSANIQDDGSSDVTYTIKQEEEEVAGRQDTVSDQPEEAAVSKTVFGQLAAMDLNVEPKAVLAGANEATQSTVPETGTFGVTVGLFMSLVAFLGGLYVISQDPRKMALLGFEKDALKDL